MDKQGAVVSDMATREESKYEREELIANAEALFSCKKEVIAGALHGIKQEKFTIAEMKKIIDDFLNRKVGN